MTLEPEKPPTPPAFSANLQLSATGMKLAGWGGLVILLLVGLGAGILTWEDVVSAVGVLRP